MSKKKNVTKTNNVTPKKKEYNPAKTWWGKIIVVVLLIGMIGFTVIFSIIEIIKNM